MPDLGPAELLIVLAIVVLVFGGSRLAEVGGSLGKGIKDFRKAMTDDDEVSPETAAKTTTTATATASPIAAALPAGGVFCSKCGTPNAAGARFCAECGTGLAVTVAEPETVAATKAVEASSPEA